MASAAEWSKRVLEWRASGESAREFASRRGFAAATLRWWSSRLGHGVKPRDVRLARVARAPSVEAVPIVIELGRARVLVPVGADSATIASVLAALGSAS